VTFFPVLCGYLNFLRTELNSTELCQVPGIFSFVLEIFSESDNPSIAPVVGSVKRNWNKNEPHSFHEKNQRFVHAIVPELL